MATTGDLLIKFDGDVEDVTRTHDHGELPMIEIGSHEYYIAPSTEVAGDAVRDRWRDMKDHDKREFRALIGDERLIQWACGESDSFGLSGFDEFLDAVGRHPEEELAGYDGHEVDAMVNIPLAEAIGWENFDDAELDSKLLAQAIRDGDVEIPAEIRAAHTHLTADDADMWVGLLIAAEFPAEEDGTDEVEAILNTFRFVPCVAYRHN